MKKVIFCLTLIFSVLSVSEAYAQKPLKITRKGSSNGITYDYVRQDPGFFVNKLKCLKPGVIKCEWVSVGSPNDGVISQTCDDLNEIVSASVLSGNTSGSTGGDGYMATWTGSINSYGFADYEINVEFDED